VSPFSLASSRKASSNSSFGVRFLLAAAVLTVFSRAARALVITEVHYHPPGTGADSRRFEFIEIYNEDPDPVDITGYSFDGVEFTIPYRTFLPGRSYLVVCADEAAIRSAHGIDNAIGNWNPVLPIIPRQAEMPRTISEKTWSFFSSFVDGDRPVGLVRGLEDLTRTGF
jgi:hypothetical protein